MSATMEHLREEIEQQESVIDSAVTFINGVANRIREALASGSGDSSVDSELSQLADELDQHTTKLATAIAENTSAAEDSDSFYDPEPIGTDYTSDQSDQPDESEQNDGDTSMDNTADGTGDSTSVRSGAGVVGDDTAVDTSATTDDTMYGNGDGSVESASDEQPPVGNQTDASAGQPDTGSTTEESSGSSTDSSDSSDEDTNSAA